MKLGRPNMPLEVQQELVRLVKQGYTDFEIATVLQYSKGTVATYRRLHGLKANMPGRGLKK